MSKFDQSKPEMQKNLNQSMENLALQPVLLNQSIISKEFEIDSREITFKLELSSITDYRQQTSLAKYQCGKQLEVSPAFEATKSVPTINWSKCFCPPKSSIFKAEPVQYFHEFLKLSLLFAGWPLMLPVVLMGLLALTTSFNHDNISFTYLLNFFVAANTVSLFNLWLVKRKQFSELVSRRTQDGPEQYSLMLYGIDHKRSNDEIFYTYLQERSGRIHRPRQAPGFHSNLKKLVKLKRELATTQEALTTFGEAKVRSLRNWICLKRFRPVGKIKSDIVKQEATMANYASFSQNNADPKISSREDEFKEKGVIFVTMMNPTHTKRLLGVWRRKPCSKVSAVRAPPPVDVYWENLAHNSYLLQILFILLTCLFACAVGAVLFIAQEQQKSRNGFALGLLISFIIFISDKVGEMLLKLFTILERHHSLTQAQIYFAYKLVIFNSLFSIFLPLVVYRDPATSSSGLLNEIAPSLLLFAFLGPLAYFYNASYLIKQVRYCCLKQKLRKAKQTYLSLKQAQNLASKDTFHFARRYAESLIPLFLSAFYLPLFPAGALISALGAYFNHIMTVWQWVTIYQKPAPLSPRIAKHFIMVLVMIPVFMFIGAIVTFALLPRFPAHIHIPLHIFFLSFFFLSVYLVHKIIQSKLEAGQQYKGKCARWLIRYFHCDPDYSLRVASMDHNSIDLLQKEGGGGEVEKKIKKKMEEHVKKTEVKYFDEQDYWDSMNDYVFQDPVHSKTAMLKMYEKKQQESDNNSSFFNALELQKAKTQKQSFLEVAIQQVNKALYSRENKAI